MSSERRKGLLGRLRRRLGRALADYAMTSDGDRILVAVSGGKDSLALLHILQTRKSWIPIDYELLPVHVTLGEEADRGRVDLLEKELAALGLELTLIETDIAGRLAAGGLPESPCFHCARWKRKALFDYAGRQGLAKIAFGHHRDDLLETALLNLFYGSSFSTMRPHQVLFSGRLTLIRPLAYVEETEIIAYCRRYQLPLAAPECPFQGSDSRRRAMKDLLAGLQDDNPKVKSSLFHALHNVRHEYLPDPAGKS